MGERLSYANAPRWLKLTVNWLLRPLGVRRPMIGFVIFLSKEQRDAIKGSKHG